MTTREYPHPAITMSKDRARAWELEATNEEFYEFLTHLSNIYAKRNYKHDGVVDTTLLFRDYKDSIASKE